MKKRSLVLVIEDNPTTRKLVRLTLGNEGFSVIEAGDAAEGLALAAKMAPDLILQDLLLPDMDGFELVARLRAIPSVVAVPIIAFSGFLSRLEYSRAAGMGFTDSLLKPVQPSQLVQVVRAHLPEEPPPESRDVGRGRRVLVVDDDPVQLKLARLRLALLGFDVSTATDGVEALEVLRRGGIEAVLSDVLMPRIDGFSLCAEIRKDEALASTPVILLSSNYVEEADRKVARAMGARAFVVRTPDLAAMIDALNAVFSPHPTSIVPPVDETKPGSAHHLRVLHQLERQAAMNAAFAHGASMHASMLSVVAGISEALMRTHGLDGALPDLLSSLLDGCGVSRGALFVSGATTAEPLVMAASSGFTGISGAKLANFYGQVGVFDRAVAARGPLVLGRASDDDAGRALLASAEATSALLIPFVPEQECLGVLLLLSNTRDLTEDDWIPFSRMMAVQVGQGLALSRAVSKLAASENRYRVLLESANDCICTLDASGHFLEVNAATERLLGRDRSKLVGALCGEFMVAEDRAELAPALSLLRETGRFAERRWRFTRPDGTIVTSDAGGTLVHVEGEELVLGILRDVTERTRAEADLALLQSVLLAASEAADSSAAFEVVLRMICESGIWIFGAAWVPSGIPATLGCSRLWVRNGADRERLAGLATPRFRMNEGVLGRAWSSRQAIWIRDLSTETDCSRTPSAAAAGIHAGLVVPVVSKDEVVAILEFFDATTKEDERFAGLVSTIAAQLASVIQRKRAEDALRASEARFSRLSESGIIGITLSDMKGNILDANATYLEMLGYSRAELVAGAASWQNLTPVESTHLAEHASAQLRERGVASPWETDLLRKDGSRVPTLMGVAMVDETTCVSFTANLSDQKRAEHALKTSEEQLRQSQKMEAVGRLAGGVAHDFNNVLSIILSYGEMMLDELKPNDPMRADLGEICLAAKRAADLTRQLLMFSRQHVLAPKILDLNEVLRDMHRMLERILGEDVEMVSLSAPGLGRVRVDPTSIEQVIMNLVVNARDAMPLGGKLTIETSNVFLDEAFTREHASIAPGEYVMLAVSDNGIGMSKATAARIFEPFFTTKPMDKGTGLGLSTVFGIVQQSGGTVWVYSELGKGTCFKIYLPSLDAAVESSQPAPLALTPPVILHGAETILLVEDEDQVRIVARSILLKHGYRVIEARNAGEALLICEQSSEPIHLLLTDVVMPRMSGPQLAKRMARLRPEMRVLCMSGYTDDSIVRHGVLEGDIAYLQKPITPQTLTKKVREVLDATAPARALGKARTRRDPKPPSAAR